MTTPAPVLAVTASSDQASYSPGATVTISASAVQTISDDVTVSVSDPSGATATVGVTFSVVEPAVDATFSASDTLGISWSVAAGSEPGTAIITGVIPQPSA